LAEPPRIRPSPSALALGAGGLAFAFAYPAAAERALASWGTRPVAALLVAGGMLSMVSLRRHRGLPGLGTPARSALLALPALAVTTGQGVFLRLVPAAIQVVLASVFFASLRDGGSILQQAARRIHPYAPDFIGPYCRKVTLLFASLFLVQAAVLVHLAAEPGAHWALTSSALTWLPLMALSAIEWFVRKAWFRYFGAGPVDRLLRVLLPPERTEQGRRSLEYVRTMRRQLGMPPP
jgi:uncharacterized membrane protein